MMFFAAADLPTPIAVAVIAGVVAITTSLVAFFLNRRGGEDTWTLGLIHQTQESQKAALDTANAQLVRQDEKLSRQEDLIQDLRDQVSAMRAELDQALRNHRECEAALLKLRHRFGEADQR